MSAGFDAHRDDPLAECELTEDSYAAMTAAMRELSAELDAPLLFVLEGGYDLGALARSVAATIESATGAGAAGEHRRVSWPWPPPVTTRAGGRTWSAPRFKRVASAKRRAPCHDTAPLSPA